MTPHPNKVSEVSQESLTGKATAAERKRARYFEYLDTLRESGVTNMWGAGLYLERAFTIPSKEANAILGSWMKTVSDEPAIVRARAALKSARGE